VTLRPEVAALMQALEVCGAHRGGLQDALEDLRQSPVSADALAAPGKELRRLLDQFAYRYTRLQDDMGARLFPAALRALGEDVAAMPVIDRLNRLEQLGWLPSAEEWADLRRIRNEFTHEYPESAEERRERLDLAIASARRLVDLLGQFERQVAQRFPQPGPGG
jgi:hypothetical protein